MTKDLPKIALFILICVSFYSCSLTKRVPEGQRLLTENTLYQNGKKTNKEETVNQLYQQPNSYIPLIGYRLRLNLYNLANPKADSTYHAWLDKNPKKEKVLINLLSRKQVDRLGESFAIAGINNFLINTGEAPVIYDPKRTDRSTLRLKNYFFNQGYFDTKITTDLDTTYRKKIQATYYIETGEAYKIDSLKTTILTAELDSIYQKNIDKTLLKKGDVFKVNNFSDERKRITADFRNNGAYYFQESNIRYEVDTLVPTPNIANIDIIIENRTVKSGDTLVQSPFKIYKISEVNIFTNNSARNLQNVHDSIQYNNFNILSANKLDYRPKAITDAIFITKGSTYNDFRRVLTSRAISNLKVFNYPSIEYLEDKRDSTGQSLITNIFLTPRKKLTFNPSLDVTHSNIQDFGVAGNVGLMIRNIFKGAEILEFGLRGSIGSSRQMSNPDNVFFNVTEYGADVKLSFPRLFFPLKTEKIIPKRMLPTTMMSFGLSKQKNIGLDKDNFTGILNYGWSPKRNAGFSLDLFNLQYVRNTNPSNYFTVYKSSYNTLNSIASDYDVNPNYVDTNGNLTIQDGGANSFINDALNPQNPLNITPDDVREIRSINERRIRLSENNLILAANITYTLSSRTDINDNNFFTLKTKVESAGAAMNLITKGTNSNVNANGNRTFLDVEFSQYIKTEIDFVKYWDLGRQQVLAFRSFGGIAIPYGNSNSIPFSRSYFAGGSNDNRAWQSYRLGPGSSGGINDFNEANMKIALNAEYRFNFSGKWFGALFIDAGNIWNVFDQTTDPKYTFNDIGSLKEIAIGSGFGIRYDFSFFVFRLDLGFKTYNPAKEEGKKWFKELNFNQSVVNLGINYPF